MTDPDDIWAVKCHDCGWLRVYEDRGTGIPPKTSAQKAKAGHISHPSKDDRCFDVEVKRPELEDLLVPEDDDYTHVPDHGVLGVAPDADADEIRGAFRAIAQRHHPDSGPEPDREKLDAARKAKERLLS